jgi:hypothetical protein
LVLPVLLGGCVVSTASPPGREPVLPVQPQAVSSGETAETTNRGGPLEVGARHILISYRGASHAAPYITRSKEEARYLAVALRERALAGEDFGELAKENSDDRGSAAAGGDLGRFRREQMVPEFSDAAFSLEPGGISEVIESQFGFHIIQRTE